MVAAPLALCGIACSVGPDYHRPDVRTPTTFKSPTTQAVSPLRQDWWTLFNDPELTALEESSLQANYDIAAAMQRVVQAREAAAATGSAFYPVITANPQVTRSRSPLGSTGSSQSTSVSGNRRNARTGNLAQLPFDLNYEVDIWGRVRRSYEAANAQAQAVANDLAVVQQTVTADVAQNYFTLRSLDAQDDIIGRNVVLFRKQLDLSQSQYKAGLVGQIDVLQAQTQLDSTLAQQQDVQRQRADVEHAIAILIGRAPVELSVKKQPLDGSPPMVPAGLPADLLRQRPDVAEAEQNLIAANAQVGVATANFYPNFQLTAAAGFESVDIRHTLDWENRFWSIGPSATIPIFEGGKLTAQLKQAKARYEELVATYRQTVLGAFRDVEDALTDLRLRSDQAAATERAVVSARESVRLSEIQYKQGLTSYLQIIDADRTLLTNELSAAQIREQRMISSVLLIKAMGGGWGADHGSSHPTTAHSR
jgi:multidrug efflux system outer membrane protein